MAAFAARSARHLYAAALSALLVLFASAAWAHGDWKPQHDGILNDGETTFEFVFKGLEVDIYLSDHGEPLPSEGASCKLEVTVGEQLFVYSLEPAGENRLRGKIERQPTLGDKLVARAVMKDGSVRVGRIQLK
jgi:hypothetical protein